MYAYKYIYTYIQGQSRKLPERQEVHYSLSISLEKICKHIVYTRALDAYGVTGRDLSGNISWHEPSLYAEQIHWPSVARDIL